MSLSTAQKCSEADLTAAIRAACNSLPGVMLMRNAQTLTRGRGYAGLGPGSADLVGVVHIPRVDLASGGSVVYKHGRFVALEVKLPNGAPVSTAQAEWMDRVRQLGGFAAVVTSVAEAVEAVRRAARGEER